MLLIVPMPMSDLGCGTVTVPGSVGATVSSVTASVEAAEALPAVSVAVTESELAPSVSVPVAVMVKYVRSVVVTVTSLVHDDVEMASTADTATLEDAIAANGETVTVAGPAEDTSDATDVPVARPVPVEP